MALSSTAGLVSPKLYISIYCPATEDRPVIFSHPWGIVSRIGLLLSRTTTEVGGMSPQPAPFCSGLFAIALTLL